MKKVWSIPIEPYEDRYSEQWARWIPEAFRELEMPHEMILGNTKTAEPIKGEVFDAIGTCRYKLSQLATLCYLIEKGSIKDGDIIFFHDLWLPGAETLLYLKKILNKKIQIYGILHAGTWDEHDFLNRYGLADMKGMERTLLAMADKVFVGSEFHKSLIMTVFPGMAKKIKVTGLPFEADEVKRPAKKENIIVFPHRLAPEKRPQLFDAMAERLSGYLSGFKFIKTQEVCENKEQFYALLGKAKVAVSFALQETFGYAMMESVANGCIPVVPDRLSYREFYGTSYAHEEEAFFQVKTFAENYAPPPARFLEQFATKKILKSMFHEDFPCGS